MSNLTFFEEKFSKLQFELKTRNLRTKIDRQNRKIKTGLELDQK